MAEALSGAHFAIAPITTSVGSSRRSPHAGAKDSPVQQVGNNTDSKAFAMQADRCAEWPKFRRCSDPLLQPLCRLLDGLAIGA